MTESVEVIPATQDQEPILANLMELYAHDFSEFHELELGEDGRFGYSSLPLYWSEPHRHPFLVRSNGKLAGFVLVQQGPGISGEHTVWDMAEFFVLRKYRKRGIGAKVATDIWTRFPGKWEVRVMQSNHAALPFWKQAISTFTGEAIKPVGINRANKFWQVFSFESAR
jgi:predicted acetyltransferase